MGDEAAGDVLKRVRINSHVERIKRRKEMYSKQRQLTSGLSHSELSKGMSEEEVINAARVICSGPNDSREESLMNLKKAFLLDQCHILSFMKVEGALHALVGLLMSKKPVEQLLAAECCNNLALGDSKTCFKLAKSAAPYLISILQGLNYNLMNVCIMSFFNLSTSGKKTCVLLYTQGILKVLERTMTIPELRENTFKTLISFTKNGADCFTEADVRTLLSNLFPYFEMVDTVQWLVYLLSSFPFVNSILFQKDIHKKTLTLLCSYRQICYDNILSVTSLLRILGNLIPDKEGITASLMVGRWETTSVFFKTFLESDYIHLEKEMHWVISNIFNHRNPRIQSQVKGLDLSWMRPGLVFPG